MATTEQKTKLLNGELLEISNDPINGMKRKVSLEKFIWDRSGLNLMLQCRVYFCEEDHTPIVNSRRFAPYERILQTGSIDIETGVNVEYEGFVQMANGAINIFDLIIDTIMLRDSQGKFDI